MFVVNFDIVFVGVCLDEVKVLLCENCEEFLLCGGLVFDY